MPDTKIIHVVGSLDHGGAERFVTDLCNELARKPLDVILVSLCENAVNDSLIDQVSERVQYVSFSKKKGLSLAVLLRLTQWLRKQRPTVVHSHLNSSEYLMFYRLISRRTSFYHTLHNVAEEECPEFPLKLIRKIFYSLNMVTPVTISAECSDSYRRYYHLKNDQMIENARNTIQPTPLRASLEKIYKSSPDEILLVHIGRISIEKNQALLIRAVKSLNQTEAKKCRLLMIGEIKDALLYHKLLSLAGGDPQIEFLGLRKNIADYLSIADAFCLSSSWEGMPISLIEAMSLGCIPVCTAVGGIPDMITDGFNGFLSKPDDLNAYRNALRKIIRGENLSKLSKRTVQTYRNRYQIGISAGKYLNMYSHENRQHDTR
jgi:glycosyltransferase involved in cell wall biosynthesis